MEDKRSSYVERVVLQSPLQNRRAALDSDITEEIFSRIHLDQQTQLAYHSLQKELHQQRLENIRQKVNLIQKEDWIYPSVDSLIGLK